jgi:ComF family protein
MPALLTELAAGALDLVLPRHCPVSGRPLSPHEPGPCAPDVLRAVEVTGTDYCTRCGAPQGKGVGAIARCASCEEAREGFGTREMVAVGSYAGVLKEICLALKFGGARNLATPLAAWLAQLVHDRGMADKVDVIIPVPLHVLRQFQRGYNQAQLVARAVARFLEKPLLADALRRVHGTQRQALLSAAQRKRNVEDAFVVRPRHAPDLKGMRVLLVDDVMTTGATFAAAARALRKGGARAVYGAVAARANQGSGA